MIETNINRYMVRRGTNLWMVWDRVEKAPAKAPGGLQFVFLEQAAALRLCQHLNEQSEHQEVQSD